MTGMLIFVIVCFCLSMVGLTAYILDLSAFELRWLAVRIARRKPFRICMFTRNGELLRYEVQARSVVTPFAWRYRESFTDINKAKLYVESQTAEFIKEYGHDKMRVVG